MASEDLLKKAVAAFNALSPEQQAEMLEEQRQSWVRGNVGLSRDERDMTSPAMREVENRLTPLIKAVNSWADRTATPVAPVSPDATGVAQTFDQIVSYVLRYGGNCRDCADVDGICPNTDMPCGFELKTAVIKHTLKALEYGLSHGFIENPFSLPAPDATGKCGELVTAAWRYRDTWEGGHKYWKFFERRLDLEDAEFQALCLRSQAEELLAAKDKTITLAETTMIEMHQDLNKLEADNAALTARVKACKQQKEAAVDNWKICAAQLEALEAKLTAAEKALEPFANAADGRKSKSVTGAVYFSQHYLLAARAALGGEP